MEVFRSAFRHGIVDEDIQHAIRGALVVDEIGEDPSRYLVLGPDRAGIFWSWSCWTGRMVLRSSTQWP
ncbi:MAG: hypothetical protein WKF73_07235 [Nocardioidaceae bacterium]